MSQLIALLLVSLAVALPCRASMKASLSQLAVKDGKVTFNGKAVRLRVQWGDGSAAPEAQKIAVVGDTLMIEDAKQVATIQIPLIKLLRLSGDDLFIHLH